MKRITLAAEMRDHQAQMARRLDAVGAQVASLREMVARVSGMLEELEAEAPRKRAKARRKSVRRA